MALVPYNGQQNDLNLRRLQVQQHDRFRSNWERMIARLEKEAQTIIPDVLDLNAEEVVEDNGHLRNLAQICPQPYLTACDSDGIPWEEYERNPKLKRRLLNADVFERKMYRLNIDYLRSGRLLSVVPQNNRLNTVTRNSDSDPYDLQFHDAPTAKYTQRSESLSNLFVASSAVSTSTMANRKQITIQQTSSRRKAAPKRRPPAQDHYSNDHSVYGHHGNDESAHFEHQENVISNHQSLFVSEKRQAVVVTNGSKVHTQLTVNRRSTSQIECVSSSSGGTVRRCNIISRREMSYLTSPVLSPTLRGTRSATRSIMGPMQPKAIEMAAKNCSPESPIYHTANQSPSTKNTPSRSPKVATPQHSKLKSTPKNARIAHKSPKVNTPNKQSKMFPIVTSSSPNVETCTTQMEPSISESPTKLVSPSRSRQNPTSIRRKSINSSPKAQKSSKLPQNLKSPKSINPNVTIRNKAHVFTFNKRTRSKSQNTPTEQSTKISTPKRRKSVSKIVDKPISTPKSVKSTPKSKATPKMSPSVKGKKSPQPPKSVIPPKEFPKSASKQQKMDKSTPKNTKVDKSVSKPVIADVTPKVQRSSVKYPKLPKSATKATVDSKTATGTSAMKTQSAHKVKLPPIKLGRTPRQLRSSSKKAAEKTTTPKSPAINKIQKPKTTAPKPNMAKTTPTPQPKNTRKRKFPSKTDPLNKEPVVEAPCDNTKLKMDAALDTTFESFATPAVGNESSLTTSPVSSSSRTQEWIDRIIDASPDPTVERFDRNQRQLLAMAKERGHRLSAGYDD